MTEIKDGNLCAKIDSIGAQLRSLKKDGKELLWQGDDKFWEDTSPVLFPMCSNLKDGYYICNGKKYIMPSHGFARFCKYEAEKISDSCVKMTLKSNADTLKQYPFDFVFSVIYTLENGTLKTEYITENPADADMYFSVGAHEGYNCEGGFENYDVLFNKTECFDACILDGDVLSHNKEKILPDGKVISLKPEYFDVDAIILENINSDEISLVNRVTGDAVTVSIADFENLLIWTIPGAPFVCLEPWCGFPDYNDTDHDFTKKKSIIKLAPHSKDVRCHVIRV